MLLSVFYGYFSCGMWAITVFKSLPMPSLLFYPKMFFCATILFWNGNYEVSKTWNICDENSTHKKRTSIIRFHDVLFYEQTEFTSKLFLLLVFLLFSQYIFISVKITSEFFEDVMHHNFSIKITELWKKNVMAFPWVVEVLRNENG